MAKSLSTTGEPLELQEPQRQVVDENQKAVAGEGGGGGARSGVTGGTNGNEEGLERPGLRLRRRHQLLLIPARISHFLYQPLLVMALLAVISRSGGFRSTKSRSLDPNGQPRAPRSHGPLADVMVDLMERWSSSPRPRKTRTMPKKDDSSKRKDAAPETARGPARRQNCSSTTIESKQNLSLPYNFSEFYNFSVTRPYSSSLREKGPLVKRQEEKPMPREECRAQDTPGLFLENGEIDFGEEFETARFGRRRHVISSERWHVPRKSQRPRMTSAQMFKNLMESFVVFLKPDDGGLNKAMQKLKTYEAKEKVKSESIINGGISAL